MTLTVHQGTLQSSTAYNRQKDGTEINNKIIHGITVQIISNVLLCCTLDGYCSLPVDE